MNPEELFEKLITNQISRAEFEELLEGLDDEDILARYEMYLQSHFEKEVENHFSGNEDEHISQKSKLTISKKYVPKKDIKPTKKGRGNFPIAAIFVLFVGLAFAVLFILSQAGLDPSNEIVRTTILPEIITKSTPKGRKFRMTLEDGSFVHMNSVSNITYPNKFDSEVREIEIKGEAYFNIKRDESRPFKIKVKDYQVQVLGTAFNIKAYKDEEDFSVTVESGSVKVVLDGEGKNTAVLEKDQKLIFNPKTNITEIVEVESSKDLSWREGILRFESTPMSEVEKTLERWYGIDLVISNREIYQKSFTGIHQNKNIKSVIEALAYATRTNYFIKGNSIIIKN